MIYHIPVGRKDSTCRAKYDGMPSAYYVPRPVFEDRKDSTEQSFATFNVFGWRGSKKIPSIYDDVFKKIDGLNGEIASYTSNLNFEKFKENSANKLFGFDAFDTYLNTQKELVEKCRENSDSDRTLEEQYNQQNNALDEALCDLEKEGKSGGVLLETRLAFWRNFKDKTGRSSGGWTDRHIKELKKARSKRNAALLKKSMYSDFKDNRSGSRTEEYIQRMGNSKQNAEDIKGKIIDDINSESTGSRLDVLRYSVVDELALKYRDTNAREVTIYTIMTAITSFFLALYLIPNNSLLFTGLYLFFSLFAVAVLYWNGSREVQTQYLDYRTLAESLRVKVYWNLLGISYSGNSDSYSYLRNDLMWVRSVFKSWHTDADSMPKDTLRSCMDFCECTWVADQFSYHEMKTATVSVKNIFSKNIALVFLIIGTLLSINSFLIELVDADVSEPMIKVVSGSFWARLLGDGTVLTHDNILKISVATANLIYAALITYMTKLIYGGNRKSMQMKAKMYRTAFKRYSDFIADIDAYCKSSEQKRRKYIECANIFRELGVQALEEVNSWAALHRSKRVSSFYGTYKDAN